jgi:hypothetical protein
MRNRPKLSIFLNSFVLFGVALCANMSETTLPKKLV